MVLMFIWMLGCEKKQWKRAKAENTIPAYEAFLEQYPDGSLADTAHKRLEELYNERHPAFRNTSTIKLTIKQSYGIAQDVILPFKGTAKRVLEEHAGLRVVGPEAKDYDVILKIKVKGKPIEAFYQPMEWHFSGAFLSGLITLEIPGMDSYKKSFSGKIEPKKEIFHKYPNPSDAPFYKTYNKSSFRFRLLEIIRDIYGINALINICLKEEHPNLRGAATEALSEIIDSSVVKPLITALKERDWDIQNNVAEALTKLEGNCTIELLIVSLKDEDEIVRYFAAKILKQITVQSFGEDYEAWSKWWQENRNEFQAKMEFNKFVKKKLRRKRGWFLATIDE
jgi:hypothetical protein